MRKYLFIVLVLFGFFRVGQEARADFGGTAFVVGVVVGIAVAEVSHYNLDKKAPEGESEEKIHIKDSAEVDEDEEFFKN